MMGQNISHFSYFTPWNFRIFFCKFFWNILNSFTDIFESFSYRIDFFQILCKLTIGYIFNKFFNILHSYDISSR